MGRAAGSSADERGALRATTLCEAFQISAARVPDRIALVDHADQGRALTWSAYAAGVERVAGALATLGVRRGERVAFLARNRPELAIAEAATLHLGAAGVVLYAASPPATIEHVLRDSEPLLLLVESELDGRLAEVRHAVPQTLTLDGESTGRGSLATIAAPAGFDFEAAWHAVQPDDLAGLLYTSGTTGLAKGVQWTHRGALGSHRSGDAVIGGERRHPRCFLRLDGEHRRAQRRSLVLVHARLDAHRLPRPQPAWRGAGRSPAHAPARTAACLASAAACT
jgi:long-chain acyl-CoA synthetase